MPDWRKADDYKYTADLTLQQWAWEFLRRGSKYKDLMRELGEFFERACERTQAGEQVTPPTELFDVATELGLGGHIPKADVRADKIKDMRWSGGVRIVYPGLPFSQKLPVVALAFNVLLPLEPQLRSAEQILQATRQKLEVEGYSVSKPSSRRIRKDVWPIYLRLLDARSAGAKIADMGRIIYPDKGDPRKSAQNALRKAEDLANFGYLDLLARDDVQGREGRETKIQH